MLTDISWASYLNTIGAATLIWYFTIALLYKRTEIRNFLNGKRSIQTTGHQKSFESETRKGDLPGQHTARHTSAEPALQDFELIEELVDRVKSAALEAVHQQDSKEIFLATLGKILKDYPVLLNSQFKPSIIEFITTESEQQGFDGISAQDVESLWQKK